MAIVSLYFSTLFSRIFILFFLCSFIPMALFAFNYPYSIVLSIFKDIILLSVPWFLWFHQSWFSALMIPQKMTDRILSIIISVFISSLLVVLLFPYSQRAVPLVLNKILPNITAPKNKVIFTDKGSLIIDDNIIKDIFVKSNATALWIDSNYIIFNELKTNQHSFFLSEPETFTSFGYYKQSGNMEVEFDDSYPSFPQYMLGQNIIQTWFDNMINLNNKIIDLYVGVGVVLPYNTNSQLTNIRYKGLFTRNLVYNSVPQNSNQKEMKKMFFSYLNIFSSILCVFSVASLIGILLTIGQNFLGVLALLLICSLYAPGVSVYIMNISLKLQHMYPLFSLTVVNMFLVIIISVCYLIATNVKDFFQGERYQ